MATIATEATDAARDLFALVTADRQKVLAARGSTLAAARLFELLPSHPILTIAGAMRLLATTRPTASKAVAALVDASILVETSGRKRDQTFGYAAYLERLRQGTEIP